MNTINELRGTLAEHAEITDHDAVDRSASIARRVRVARRRRTGALAVAAAAVVAGTTLGVTLPHGGGHDAKLAARLVGVEVPTTMTANGYTYEYADAALAPAGSDVASVTVKATDSPIVVAWATEGADQRVRVHTGQGEAFNSGLPDFGDYVYVPEGSGRTTVEVTGHSRTALAVYHLGSTPPDGVTSDGVTFRREVTGNRLAGAKFAPDGANSVSFGFTMPAGATHLAFADLCSTTGGTDVQGSAWMVVSIKGHSSWGESCQRGDGTFDPAGQGSSEPGATFRPGEHVQVSVRLLDRPGGQPVDDPHARLGMAAYAVTDQSRSLPGGLSLPQTIEDRGHTWRLVSTASGTASTGVPVSAQAPSSGERSMVVATARTISGSSKFSLYERGSSDDIRMQVGPDLSPFTGHWAPVDSGKRIRMVVRGAAARVGVGFYELAD